MTSHQHLTRKQRKQLQYKKNRARELLFQHLRQRRAEAARVRAMEEAGKKKGEPKGKKDWSDKVSKVRNRLTGKKRESKERWNRFAGTGEAGGRGL